MHVPKTRRMRQRAAEAKGRLLREALQEFDLLSSMLDALPASDPLCRAINGLIDARPDAETASEEILRGWGLWFEVMVEWARRRVC